MPAEAMLGAEVVDAFDWGNTRDSKTMMNYEAPKMLIPALGQHASNVKITGGLVATRRGGLDADAVVVGATGIQLANPAQRGVGTFSWVIRKTGGNDGLGVFVGVADGDTDFTSTKWQKAWAMGCHGCNLFEWSDARAAGTLIYGGLPGSEESLEDGSTVTVKVDLASNPRTLAYSINGGVFVTCDGCELPASVRPFCKLAGGDGDSVALTYPLQSDGARSASLDSDAIEHLEAGVKEVWNRSERITPDSVVSFLA